MLTICARQLEKQFVTYKKEAGLRGSLQSLFVRRPIVHSAVKSFDLDAHRGEIIGLLGPNGAGKTTLMKMFTGIIVPTSGQLEILGFEPARRDRRFRKRIALVMGQKSQLWWDIPAMDSFLLLQKYYEIPEAEFRQRLNELATLLEVEPMLRIHVRKLSLGERMKMELMASLLHQPEILFLDEPTIGLDLIAQANIRRFLVEYHQRHRPTILLTSHYMADVEALCQRIVLILKGEKKFDGSISTFGEILGREKMVKFRFSDPDVRKDSSWNALSPRWSEDGLSVELRIPEENLRETCAKILQRYPVTEFQTEKMPIERVMSTLMANPHLLDSPAPAGAPS